MVMFLEFIRLNKMYYYNSFHLLVFFFFLLFLFICFILFIFSCTVLLVGTPALSSESVES